MAFTGCQKSETSLFQGYVEGEYVYVSSPLSGALQTLSVERGAQVNAGTPLFTLENGLEKAARDEADRLLATIGAVAPTISPLFQLVF